MNEIELRDTDLIRILKNSLSDLDTIRLEAKEEHIKIFGVDAAGVLYTELTLNKNAFYKYEIPSPKGMSISLDGFKRILDIASSGSLTEFNSMFVSFTDNYIDIKIKAESAKYDDKLFNIPTGIREPPPLPNFDNASSCELNVIKDFRLGSTVFAPSKAQDMPATGVLVEISENKKCIKFKPSDPTIQNSFKLIGYAYGSGETAVSTYVLDVVSKVAELQAIKKLKIYLINRGSVKFSYSFDNGELNYIAAAFII